MDAVINVLEITELHFDDCVVTAVITVRLLCLSEKLQRDNNTHDRIKSDLKRNDNA